MCVCVILNFTKIKAAAQFSRDTEVNGADEATVSPMANREQQEIVRKKILDNQYKCFEKMNRDPPYNKSGNKNIKWNENLGFSTPLLMFKCHHTASML